MEGQLRMDYGWGGRYLEFEFEFEFDVIVDDLGICFQYQF